MALLAFFPFLDDGHGIWGSIFLHAWSLIFVWVIWLVDILFAFYGLMDAWKGRREGYLHLLHFS